MDKEIDRERERERERESIFRVHLCVTASYAIVWNDGCNSSPVHTEDPPPL